MSYEIPWPILRYWASATITYYEPENKQKVEEGYGTRERADINIVHITKNLIFMKHQLPNNNFWFLGSERVRTLTDSPRLKANQADNV